LCSLQGTCPNNCSGAAGTPGAAGEGFRTIVPAQVWQPGRKIPAAVPGEPAAVPNNCTIPPLEQVDPDPDSGGITCLKPNNYPD